MTLERRNFLGLCAVTAGCFVIGGVGAASVAFAGPADDMVRPPGGQNEQSLFSACVKCDRCRSACPTNVIAVSSLEDGFLSARTPKMDFHKGYCDYCNKCIDSCPTGALKRFDPSSEKIGVAIVQKDRCIAYIQGCNNCKDSCVYGALSFDSYGHPVIDGELCNGCGKCEYDCTALVYGTFSGGTRRGIVVVNPDAYQELGTTLVEGTEA